MERHQLIGHYARVRMELSAAYRAHLWNGPHIDRLADDLARIEQAIIKTELPDERAHDAFLGFTD
jgi:hypothetical protein